MPRFIDPAIKALTSAFTGELVWAQVLITRQGNGFELRHVSDRETPHAKLKLLQGDQLRDLATFAESGAFRPLKSAPTLRAGWRSSLKDDADLSHALSQLYPGSVADWFAAMNPHPHITNYREFTSRQSGMYRITTFLDDLQAAHLARAVCHPRFCLKQRLWTIGDACGDLPEEKSLIPCLEPCAVLLEMARKAVRIEQEPKLSLELAPGELGSLIAALEFSLANPDPSLRVADFASPANPRRLQLLLEKLREQLKVDCNAKSEE